MVMSGRRFGGFRVRSNKTIQNKNSVFVHGRIKNHLKEFKQITKLKATKYQHKSELIHFFNVCNTSKSAIYAIKVINQNELIIRYLNSSCEKMLGIKFEEVYGKSIYEIDQRIIPRKAITLLKICLNTKKDVEHTFFLPEKAVHMHLWPICEKNQVVHIVGLNTVIKTKQSVDFCQEIEYYQDILKEQLKFEELISKSLKCFMDAGIEGFDDCLSKTIEEIGTTFDVDQVFVVKACVNGGVFLKKNQWASKKQWLSSNLYCTLQSNKNNEWHKILRSGKMLIINNLVNHNSNITKAFQKQLRTDGIRSLFVTPIKKENEYWGFLCLTQIRACRIWTVAEIGMIKIAAETIMSAYLRTKLEKQLCESNRILIEYDESLQEMLALEEMLTTLSKAFITGHINGFERCMYNMLKKMGEMMRVDRISVSICNTNNTEDCSFYEWYRKGITSYMKGKYQNMNQLPRWHKEAMFSESIAINNTLKDLRGYPQPMVDNILQMGIKSLLLVPIKEGSKVLGMFMLQKIVGYIKWPEAYINMAKVAAEIFIGAFLRQQKEKELRELNARLAKAKQNKAKQAVKMMNITDGLALFADADASNFYDRTKQICQRIAKETLIDKISIYKFVNYPTNFLVYNWTERGLSFVNDPGPVDSVSQIETILSNPAINSVMNAQALMLGEIYTDFVEHKTVGLPINCSDKTWGFLYVSAQKSRSEWEEEEIRMLRLFGELFARTDFRIFTSTVKAQRMQFSKTF